MSATVPEASEENGAPGERILVLTPTGRDAPLACKVLLGAAMEASQIKDVPQLCQEMKIGAGAILVAEEALDAPGLEDLMATLGQQEPWSDIPCIVLTSRSETLQGSPRFSEIVDRRANITLLERPLHVSTLISTAQSALRARRRQYEVRDLLHKAERDVRQRDEFLAMLSHELRNPLAAISYSMQVLKQSDLPEANLIQARDVVERQTRQLTRLVDDLLDVSRVTQGKILLKRQPVDVNVIVTRSVQALKTAAGSQRHQVTLSLEDTPVLVEGDPVRLEQVITNLLTNAIKYTQSGGTISVAVGRVAAAPSKTPDQAIIFVRDNGIGIAPDLLPRIFDLFTQSERALDRSQGGLGIGLTLVHSLVEMHGGSVAVSSEGPGKGSEFVVRLPLLTAVEKTESGVSTALQEHPISHSGAPPQSVSSLELTPMQILVIEDNPDSRYLLQVILQREGYRVEVAEDGAKGLARALAICPPVALIDIGLPVLDGYQVARQLRAALGNRIYLIAITGYGQPQDRLRTREAGFNMHLTKPVDAMQLVQALSDISVSVTEKSRA